MALRGVMRKLPAARSATRGFAKSLGGACLDFLAPGFCRECGGPVVAGTDAFCAECIASIDWIGSACARCGIPILNPPTSPAPSLGSAPPTILLPPRCGICSALRLRFDLASAAARHSGALRTAVLRYKFHGDKAVLPILREALSRAARADVIAGAVREAEAVVPVPLHPWKRWRRGWDPALGLARELTEGVAALRNVPVVQLLRKRRWTPAQVSLKEGARRRNLRGAFAVRKGVDVPRTIVLVDDVLTTGTTASECARALKRKGARLVIVLAVARS